MFIRSAVVRQAPPAQGPQGSRSQPATIPLDAWREDDHLVIALDLPGIPIEAVEVETHGRVVTVRAERRPTPRGQDARTQVGERAHGVFARRIHLADTLDPAGLHARLADGVLTLTVPVITRARTHKITVRSGATPQPADNGRTASVAAA